MQSTLLTPPIILLSRGSVQNLMKSWFMLMLTYSIPMGKALQLDKREKYICNICNLLPSPFSFPLPFSHSSLLRIPPRAHDKNDHHQPPARPPLGGCPRNTYRRSRREQSTVPQRHLPRTTDRRPNREKRTILQRPVPHKTQESAHRLRALA